METLVKSSKKNSKKKQVTNETPELTVVAPVVMPEVVAEKPAQKKRGPKGPHKNLTKTVVFKKTDTGYVLRGKGRPTAGQELVSRVVAYNWVFDGVMPDKNVTAEEVKASKVV